MTTDQIEQQLTRLQQALANTNARYDVAIESLGQLGYASVEEAVAFVSQEREAVVAERNSLVADLQEFSATYGDLL